MRLALVTLTCLLASLSPARSAEPIKMLDPVPYASDSNVASRIKSECTDLGHEIAFMVNGLMRGQVKLVKGELPANSPGQVLKLEIVEVVSHGNAFLSHDQGMRLRGTLYRDGSKVASFVAQRTNHPDNMLTACANLDIFAPLFARDIRRWLKDPKDGAELGRSWF